MGQSFKAPEKRKKPTERQESKEGQRVISVTNPDIEFAPETWEVVKGVKGAARFVNKVEKEGGRVTSGGYGTYSVNYPAELTLRFDVDGKEVMLDFHDAMLKAAGISSINEEMASRLKETKPGELHVVAKGRGDAARYEVQADDLSAWVKNASKGFDFSLEEIADAQDEVEKAKKELSLFGDRNAKQNYLGKLSRLRAAERRAKEAGKIEVTSQERDKEQKEIGRKMRQKQAEAQMHAYTPDDLQKAKDEISRLQQEKIGPWASQKAHREEIEQARNKEFWITSSLMRSGKMELHPQIRRDMELDAKFPDAKSKKIVEHEGKRYQKKFFPVEYSKTETGKVDIWGHSWWPMR